MLKLVRFYLALAKVFLFRNKKWVSYSLVVLLLGTFLVRIILPSVFPKLVSIAIEFQKPTFIEGVVGIPVHPNPIFDTTETQRDISDLVYRGLTKIKPSGELELDLAERFEKRTDKEYVFYLKKNVFWHDGAKFTADDVVYTVVTAQDPQFKSNVSSNFKGVRVEKVDDYTVKFSLEEPFSPFPHATTIGIIPKHISLKNFKPVGTGPFKVKKIDNTKIILANEKLNLMFKFYSSIQDAKNSLKLGEIHALGGISPQEAQDLERFGGKHIYSKPLSFRQIVVFFNLNNENLKNKDFRQSLAYLIDKKNLLETIDGSGSEVSTSQLPLFSWVGKQTEMYPRDLKKAKGNMEKAGLKLKNNVWVNDRGQVSVSVTSVDDPELNSVVNFLQNSWNQYGVKTKSNTISPETLRNDILPNRNFEILVDFQKISPDPDQYVLWHSTQANNANITGIKSAKLDKILEDARVISDEGKRKEKYRLFTQLLLDETPAVFLYYPQYYWAVSQKIDGVDLSEFSNSSDRFNSFSNWKIRRKFF